MRHRACRRRSLEVPSIGSTGLRRYRPADGSVKPDESLKSPRDMRCGSSPSAQFMGKAELQAHLRERIARCRRLADGCADESAAKALRALASEAETDLKRLLTEGK